MITINFTLSYLEFYLLSISLISFLIYGYDKLLALKNNKNVRRVSEKNLLLSSLVGGSIGSLLSMFIFRHKIKKSSFIIKFSIVIIIQVVLIYLYIKYGANLL